LFDFISRKGRNEEGYTLANNDTIQVIDPTDEPGSEAQVFVAISNSLNDLVTLGCHENIRVYPVYDAPTEELRQDIKGHCDAFSKRYGVKVSERGQIGKGKLLIGATILGDMRRQPPTKYNKLEPGMQIVVSRPFGDLAPINVYLSSLADEEYEKKLKARGITLEEAKKVKDAVVETMKEPNLKIGRIINKHLPGFGQDFDSSEHVVCTGDLSGPGIYIFKEIAEIGRVDMQLSEVPLAYPDYVEFAADEYLMDNGTAGTNGAVAVIAAEHIVDSVYSDLKSEGYSPVIIGKVLEKGGEGRVYVDESIRKIVTSPSLRREFSFVKGA